MRMLLRLSGHRVLIRIDDRSRRSSGRRTEHLSNRTRAQLAGDDELVATLRDDILLLGQHECLTSGEICVNELDQTPSP